MLLRLIGEDLGRAGRWLRHLRSRQAPPPATLVAPPDTRLAKEAHALVGRLTSPHIADHCARTFAFGAALAKLHRRPYDAELLYVASLLHDLGLSHAHAGDAPFELRGAQAARGWCMEQGMARDRADRVHEAIALHTSLGVNDRTPESLYVHLGAGVDVFGFHIEELPRTEVEAILEAWPRADFKERFIADLEKEAANPRSPLRNLWRLGFASKIRSAPFD
ncbi:MAG: HD domain-containing protein [Myxococcota bacterium]